MSNKNKVIWFYGLSGAGKTSAATAAYNILKDTTSNVIHLDADVLRTTCWPELKFDYDARIENCKRITGMAKVLFDKGYTVIVSASAPYTDQRKHTRTVLPEVEFIKVATPLKVCKERKPRSYEYDDSGDNVASQLDANPKPTFVIKGTGDLEEELRQELLRVLFDV